MINLRLTAIALALAGASASAQSEEPGNRAWNVEIGGVGQLISFNMEWVLAQKPGGFWVARAGVAKYSDFGFGIPHSITWNLGNHKSFLELGLGGSLGPTTFGYADASAEFYYFAPIAGYRLHPSKGFQFRIFVSPFITLEAEIETTGIVGISFGRVFRR